MVPVARGLVRELAIDVVPQPISVSPVIPSPLTQLGAPVIMGPLNGGMELPPAFRDRDSRLYAPTKAARSVVATALNRLLRGRLEADAVLVANDRTRSLLPESIRSGPLPVIEGTLIRLMVDHLPGDRDPSPYGCGSLALAQPLMRWTGCGRRSCAAST
jgi:hypothetical protein